MESNREREERTMMNKLSRLICPLLSSFTVPDDLDALLSLPGVGPKMAFLALQAAWKKNLGSECPLEFRELRSMFEKAIDIMLF